MIPYDKTSFRTFSCSRQMVGKGSANGLNFEKRVLLINILINSSSVNTARTERKGTCTHKTGKGCEHTDYPNMCSTTDRRPVLTWPTSGSWWPWRYLTFRWHLPNRASTLHFCSNPAGRETACTSDEQRRVQHHSSYYGKYLPYNVNHGDLCEFKTPISFLWLEFNLW